MRQCRVNKALLNNLYNSQDRDLRVFKRLSITARASVAPTDSQTPYLCEYNTITTSKRRFIVQSIVKYRFQLALRQYCSLPLLGAVT